MNFLFILFSFFLSFFSATLLLPYIKKWVKYKKTLKEDTNKFKKPRLKSLEGLICVVLFITIISFILGIQTLMRIQNADLSFLIPGLLSIIIIALAGFIDDILDLPSKNFKIFFFLPVLIPIISVTFKSTVINIPFWGPLETLGFYPFLIIPAIIVVSVLAVNSPQSFNKLNLNIYFIISITLFICTLLTQSFTAAFIFSCFLGLILVLRYYHDIKHKISLGKIGRLSFGTIFAIGAIIGDTKLALVILLIPYLIYFFIRKIYKFRLKDQQIRPNKIVNFFGKKLTTDRMVNYITTLEVICALTAIVIQIQRVGFF